MNLKELEKIQREIAEKVRIKKLRKVDYVAGVDQTFFKVKEEEYIVSSAILMTFPELEPVSSENVVEKVTFPYIPTFLMFRESRPAIRVLKKILRENSVVMVDGSGLAHPRRCGLATYIGVKLEIPSIGITKKRLFGEIYGKGEIRKMFADDMHIGYELKTCKRCNPIYISVGNLITPENALDIVQKCLKGYKLPEPVRIADKLSKEKRLEYLSNFDSSIQWELR